MNKEFLDRKITRDLQYHFSGGLKGSLFDDFLRLTPLEIKNGKEAGLEINGIPKDQKISILNELGIKWIGTEELVNDGGVRFSLWHPFNYGVNIKYKIHDINQHWSSIAYAARKAKDKEGIAEKARKISFAITAASLRLRDISHEYQWHQVYGLLHQMDENHRFGMLKIFDLFTALHSFFTEMCSVRDFLAEFIAQDVLHTPTPFTRMSTLHQHLKSNPYAHQLCSSILSICDKNEEGGWMAELGAQRDGIIHASPIHHSSKNEFVHLKYMDTPYGENKLPLLTYEIMVKRKMVDALAYCHEQYCLMEEFAAFVSTFSSVEPKIAVLTDKDIIQIKHAEVHDVFRK